MDEDDLFYLAPDFESATLTVPRLRNILLTHNIDYPSNAKKPQLVQLFDDELRPQAKRLLAAAKRVKRSTRGIEDVPSSQASVADEDEQPEPEPAPPKSRVGRKKTRASEEDPDLTVLAPATSRPRRTTARGTRSSEPEPVQPDADPEPAPPPVAAPKRGRGRPSKTPVKQESPDPEAWHRPADDSPFTADNPFQSGGSSPPAPDSRSTATRRRTTGNTLDTDKRKSASSRRRTDGVVPIGDNAQTSTLRVPVSRVSRKQTPAAKQELVPAGEEFSPDEAQELAEAEASGQLVRQARNTGSSSSSLILQAITWPLVISAIFSGGLWAQEKFSVGYCGIGNAPRTDFGGVEIPDWADALRPQCEPCPPHATCFQNLETKCDDDFILQHHPLTMRGLLPLPLPPTCVPDSDKQKRVQHVVDRAIDVLRERNAKFECREPLLGESMPPASPAVAPEELKATLASKRTKKMSEEEFDNLFKEAIGEIVSRDEVVSEPTGPRAGHIRSTSRAKQSLSCAVRTSVRGLLADAARSVRRKLVQYFWPLVLTLAVLGSGVYAKQRIAWRREEEEWSRELARQAFDLLSTHASLHAEERETYPEPFLLVSHLRDQILAEDIARGWVQDLWAKTMLKVKRNSNVRELNQEMRKGDYGLTWEWIGPLTALPDSGGGAAGGSAGSGGLSRRRSAGRRSLARFSMAPPASSPLSGLSTVPPEQQDAHQDMSERRWEESRPIY